MLLALNDHVVMSVPQKDHRVKGGQTGRLKVVPHVDEIVNAVRVVVVPTEMRHRIPSEAPKVFVRMPAMNLVVLDMTDLMRVTVKEVQTEVIAMEHRARGQIMEDQKGDRVQVASLEIVAADRRRVDQDRGDRTSVRTHEAMDQLINDRTSAPLGIVDQVSHPALAASVRVNLASGITPVDMVDLASTWSTVLD